MSAEFIFPLRVASKISQSGRRSLLGTNKVTALNCKYVFPLLASLWDFTHTQRARTHTHARTGSGFTDTHTTLAKSETVSQTEVLFFI